MASELTKFEVGVLNVLEDIQNEISEEEMSKLHNEYHWCGRHYTLTPHGHRVITGKAVNLYRRMIKNGAKQNECNEVIRWVFICLDAWRYRLDYHRYKTEHHIAELEAKYPYVKEGQA